jgi:hypothetical protein
MVYQALKRIMTGAAVVFAGISLNAGGGTVVLSDLENGTSINNYGQSWYVIDDNLDGGNSTISNMTKNLDNFYDFLPTAGAGNSAAGSTPGYGAKLAFHLGTAKPHNAEDDAWGNLIGMGTRLAFPGEYMDLTGASNITFWAKVERPEGTPATVDLRVEVCTAEFEQENGRDEGYYHIIISIAGTWTKYDIPLSTIGVMATLFSGIGRFLRLEINRLILKRFQRSSGLSAKTVT